MCKCVVVCHVSAGYGSVFLNKARQVETCSFSEVLEFPLVLGRDFAGRVVAKGLGVGRDVNIGDEVWGALPPHQQGCHAQFVRVNKSLVSEYCRFRRRGRTERTSWLLNSRDTETRRK